MHTVNTDWLKEKKNKTNNDACKEFILSVNKEWIENQRMEKGIAHKCKPKASSITYLNR